MVKTEVQWSEIQIDLTDKCNAACLFCSRTNNPTRVKNVSITLKDIKKLVNDNSNINSIVMCGNLGDATANTELFNIVEYLVSQNCEIKLFTNGSVHEVNWWKKLAILMGPNNSVFFAIDGNDKKTYEKYRVNCIWEKTLENAQAYIDAGGFAIWSMVQFDWNEYQFDDTIKRARDMGFAMINKIISHRNTERGVGTHAFSNEYVSIEPRCIERKRLFVTARGNVHLCCWMGSEEDTITSPNINDFNSLQDLISSEEWSNYQNQIFDSWTTNPHKICHKKCGLRHRDRKELIPLSSSYQYYTWSPESNPPSLYKK